MIFVQGAARTKNPANACFALVEEGIIELYLSLQTLAEIEDVLTRLKLRKRFPTLTDEMVEEFLTDVKNKAIMLKSVPSVFNYPRDPKDEKYINLAVEAQADYIVSRDKDLLDLMMGYTDECKEFRRRFRPLKVIDPTDFLKEIEKNTSESSER